MIYGVQTMVGSVEGTAPFYSEVSCCGDLQASLVGELCEFSGVGSSLLRYTYSACVAVWAALWVGVLKSVRPPISTSERYDGNHNFQNP
jgi:hypothetical protein